MSAKGSAEVVEVGAAATANRRLVWENAMAGGVFDRAGRNVCQSFCKALVCLMTKAVWLVYPVA